MEHPSMPLQHDHNHWTYASSTREKYIWKSNCGTVRLRSSVWPHPMHASRDTRGIVMIRPPLQPWVHRINILHSSTTILGNSTQQPLLVIPNVKLRIFAHYVVRRFCRAAKEISEQRGSLLRTQATTAGPLTVSSIKTGVALKEREK